MSNTELAQLRGRTNDEDSQVRSEDSGTLEKKSNGVEPESPKSVSSNSDSFSYLNAEPGLDENGYYHGAYALEYHGRSGFGGKLVSSINLEVEVGDTEVLGGDKWYHNRWIDWSLLWRFTGPGWMITMAYLDAGNLEADLQAGAYSGYALLWVLWWSTVLGYTCQLIALRCGVVANLSLADACRLQYPMYLNYIIWFTMECACIGNDIQQITGTAIALQILIGVPLWGGCLLTAVGTFLLLALSMWGMRKVEAVIGSLIGMMVICFWIQFGQAATATNGLAIDSASVAYGTVVPVMNSLYLLLAVALLGGTVEPACIFLHSAAVRSRNIDRSNPNSMRIALKYYAIEAGIPIFLSFLINLAIICVFAASFYDDSGPIGTDYNANEDGNCAQQVLAWIPQPQGTVNATYGANGQFGICEEVGLQNAGDALDSMFGNSAQYIYAIGLLAAGEASTMTNTLSGQFILEGFVNIRLPQWKRLILTRFFALIPALCISFTSYSDTYAFNVANEWINIIQNIVLPFAMLPCVHFVSQKRLMGEFALGFYTKVYYWLAIGFIVVVNYYLLIQFAYQPDAAGSDGTFPQTPAFYSFYGAFLLVYLVCFYDLLKFDILEFWYNLLRPFIKDYVIPYVNQQLNLNLVMGLPVKRVVDRQLRADHVVGSMRSMNSQGREASATPLLKETLVKSSSGELKADTPDQVEGREQKESTVPAKATAADTTSSAAGAGEAEHQHRESIVHEVEFHGLDVEE